MVDGVVENLAGKITQENGLSGSDGCQPAQRVAERMVPVRLEAGSNGTDVNEEVGFYDDEGRSDTALLNGAVEQVELHAVAQQFVDVTKMFCGIVDDDGFCVC